MTTFQERFSKSFDAEVKRRRDSGEQKLTKTMVWKAAEATSGAFTQWYSGNNGAKLSTCFKIAKLLNVDPHWLFDGSGENPVTSDSTIKLVPKSTRDKLLDELLDRASRLNDIGLAMLVGEAKAYEAVHPVAPQETARSSQ